MLETRVRILSIIRGTTVDGPGFRTAIYLAGCRHKCPGCHNPESWDFNAGEEMTINEIIDVVKEEDFDVTLTGGDPMYQPEIVAALAEKISELNHTVWVYTGFTWEQLQSNPAKMKALEHVEAVVEGPYDKEKRDTDLLFRGSSNQRIIYLHKCINRN